MLTAQRRIVTELQNWMKAEGSSREDQIHKMEIKLRELKAINAKQSSELAQYSGFRVRMRVTSDIDIYIFVFCHYRGNSN
jgi:hypothetical protein